jgi:hypothetical protein
MVKEGEKERKKERKRRNDQEKPMFTATYGFYSHKPQITARQNGPLPHQIRKFSRHTVYQLLGTIRVPNCQNPSGDF